MNRSNVHTSPTPPPKKQEKILERAMYKLGVENKVIQAGMFNKRSTAKERQEMLVGVCGEKKMERECERESERSSDREGTNKRYD